MKKQEIIKKAWSELNFIPDTTDKKGYIDFELLPEEFESYNLDCKHDPLNQKPRKTWVRPKSLKKELGFINHFKRFFKIIKEKPLI